jgi:nucleoside-diphosphate-sugar epimerase
VKRLKRKIGIIGGSGFVGASIARHFVKNFEVEILDVKATFKDLEKVAMARACASTPSWMRGNFQNL